MAELGQDGDISDLDGNGVMYVARDLRSIILPDYAPNDIARARMYPSCIWTRFSGDREAVVAWRLTPALLAYLWHQWREIDKRAANGGVSEKKLAELYAKADRIMAWASVSLPPGETLREAARQRDAEKRRKPLFVLPTAGPSHTPQLALVDGDFWR